MVLGAQQVTMVIFLMISQNTISLLRNSSCFYKNFTTIEKAMSLLVNVKKPLI